MLRGADDTKYRMHPLAILLTIQNESIIQNESKTQKKRPPFYLRTKTIISSKDKDEKVKVDDIDDDSLITKDCESLEIENINNVVLLKVINSVFKDFGSQFDSIQQSIQPNNLLLFVRLFFKNDPYIFPKMNQLIKAIKPIDQKIKRMIEILTEKNEIFNLLFFNFKNSLTRESSAVLFYTNFLNCFFLKQSKIELIERCNAIIFGNIHKTDAFYDLLHDTRKKKKDPYKLKRVMLNWNTYLALVYFITTNSTHFKIDDKKKLRYFLW